MALNSAGQIVFSGRVVGPGIGAANDDALWGGLPLTPHLIARAGDAASGGGAFSSFPSFVISDSGLAAFQAFLVGAPAGSFGIYRIIIGSPVSLDKVAVEGEVAPLGGGAVFDAFFGFDGNFVPRLNNANGVAFRSRLSGAGVTAANDVGIWGHNDAGAVTLLAREGNPLPAAGTNVTIGTINNTPPALNGANRIAFRATLAGVPFGTENAIIAANALGDLVLAARTGQAVEVAPGVFRTLSVLVPITGPGTQDGSSTSWTDDCRLLFRAEFWGGVGGVGLFIADVNATCRPVITGAPAPANVALGGEAVFNVTASGPHTLYTGPTSSCATLTNKDAPCYLWSKDGVELTDGPTGTGSVISGARSSTLHVLGCGAADAGAYRAAISNLCGITLSTTATLSLNLGQVTVTSVSSGNVNLSWLGAPSVHLQSATNLTAPVAWADVPDTAGKSLASVPMAGPQTCFRLASP